MAARIISWYGGCAAFLLGDFLRPAAFFLGLALVVLRAPFLAPGRGLRLLDLDRDLDLDLDRDLDLLGDFDLDFDLDRDLDLDFERVRLLLGLADIFPFQEQQHTTTLV